MIAEIRIYDNGILKGELTVMPSAVNPNGISTEYVFSSFKYNQLNYGSNSNSAYSTSPDINIPKITGVNLGETWGSTRIEAKDDTKS